MGIPRRCDIWSVKTNVSKVFLGHITANPKDKKMKRTVLFFVMALTLVSCGHYACAERERNAKSPVYFHTDSIEPMSDSLARLDDGLIYLRQHRFKKILLEGWADETGGENQHNMDLSRARAELVRDYMITNGINSNRIETRWHGINEGDPHQMYRRVDITIK